MHKLSELEGCKQLGLTLSIRLLLQRNTGSYSLDMSSITHAACTLMSYEPSLSASPLIRAPDLPEPTFQSSASTKSTARPVLLSDDVTGS